MRSALSLNEYCRRKLAAPGPDVAEPAVKALRLAADVLDGQLRGMMAFGSWARDERTDDSDVDLLVVVAPDLPIERDLYRRWDAAPLRWDGALVEPHFVHLPSEDHRVTALWAEAAIDGVVVFDPDLSLARHLVRIRRTILDGRLIRREVHGHAYWIEAA